MASKNDTGTVRYSITSVAKMIAQLEAWLDSSQKSIDNEEARDYPNDERLEELEARIEALESAKVALEEIE